MIHLDRVSKSFGAVRAVQDISFHVNAGEVVGFLGPNGAGKTTTMRMITGFLFADSGDLRVDGKSVLMDQLAVQHEIGYLPENSPLYSDMEVVTFLTYVAGLRGVAANDMASRLGDVIDECGLSSVVGRPIGKLSKGYRQRVGLAQALIHKPKILILDEPTSGLDPNQIADIRRLIVDIGRERTVILSTHIMQEVQAMCDRAIIIHQGRLVGDGTLDELMHQSEGGVHYHLSVRAPRHEIESVLPTLNGVSVSEWQAPTESGWQSLVLQSAHADDQSEDIFDWVVAHQWKIKELRCERASLERVFYELTREGGVS